jgi:hypothetical protein
MFHPVFAPLGAGFKIGTTEDSTLWRRLQGLGDVPVTVELGGQALPTLSR